MLRSCRTCRQNRKGCDKTRPECRTCWKNGLKCGGYSQDKETLFVNLDSNNIRAGTRSIFAKAARDRTQINRFSQGHNSPQRYHDLLQPEQEDFLSKSINCLDLNEQDFTEHLTVLWNHFHLIHSSSSDAWVPSFTPLISQNRYLDLALIALSALRFSQRAVDDRIRVMSLTAYDRSLRSFQQAFGMLMRAPDTKSSRAPAASRLAATSLVYALFEAMHESPRTIFSSGVMFDNAHLKGAMSFMQQCGPESFQVGADHLVFKKLRDMIILYGFVHYEKTFLADECWTTQPWQKMARTSRDRLFDTAAQMTGLVSRVLTPDSSSLGMKIGNESTRNLAISLDVQFTVWEHTWHTSLEPACFTTLFDFIRNPQSPPIRPSEPKTATADTVFIQLEVWSLKLLLALCTSYITTAPAESSERPNASTLMTTHSDTHPVKDLAGKVEMALKNPLLRDKDGRDKGIVEGQCRSLLPAWSLMEYKRCMLVSTRQENT